MYSKCIDSINLVLKKEKFIKLVECSSKISTVGGHKHSKWTLMNIKKT